MLCYKFMLKWWFLCCLMSASDADSDDFALLPEKLEKCENASAPAQAAAPANTKKVKLGISGVSVNRSKVEHAYIMGNARSSKAKKREREMFEKAVEPLVAAVSSCMRRKNSSKHRAPMCELRKARTFRGFAIQLQKMMMRKRRGNTTADDELAVAFSKCIRVRDVAAACGVDKAAVVPMRKKVGTSTHAMVVDYLGQWRDYCKKEPPMAAFNIRGYDSASFQLSNPVELPGIGLVKGGQARR